MLQSIKEWIKGLFTTKHQEVEHTEPKRCDICNSDLNMLNTFNCKYCKHTHCDKHRLPEDHKCKNPGRPADFTYGISTHTSRGSYVYGK